MSHDPPLPQEPSTFFFYRGDGTHVGAELVFKSVMPELASAGTIEDEALRLFETLRQWAPGAVFEALCKIAAKEASLDPKPVPGIVEVMGRTHHVGMVSSERILEGERVTIQLEDGSKVRLLLKPAVFRTWEVSEETMRRAQLLLRQGADVATLVDHLTRWDADVDAIKDQGAKAFLQWFLRRLDAHGFYAASRLLQAAVAALLLGEDKIELTEVIPF